jgi:hypothetical protein
VTVTRVAQAFTVAFLGLCSLAVVPALAALAVIPVTVVLACRAYNAGTVQVQEAGLKLLGLFRTRSLHRDQVDSVDYWLVRWRATPQDRLRRWQLWPYWQGGLMLPGVTIRSDEVMDCLFRLVESWNASGATGTRPRR